jgi:hypothetical protein
MGTPHAKVLTGNQRETSHSRFLGGPIMLVRLLTAVGSLFFGALAVAECGEPWFHRLIVGMEVGPTGAQWGCDPNDEGYAARFHGAEIVEQQRVANSQYLVIWGKDSEFAYYPSKVAPRCPGLKGRDVLQEAIAAAKPLRMPVIVYCVVQGNGYPLRQHPEYRMVDSSGNPIDRICLNSGYLEHALQVVDEMMAYEIDGFHIDMLDQGFGPPYGCWCGKCRAKFEAAYGRPMPKGVTWDADWERMLEFRYRSSLDFERALREHVRRKNPRLSVDFNYHGYPPFSWEVGQTPVPHAQIGDFVTAETGIWGFSALGVGLTARFLAAATPGRPFQVAMSRHLRIYHDPTVRSVNDLRWELFTLLAHGAQVTVVDKTAYDGGLDRQSFRRVGIAFAEALAKREHFGHPVMADVGLYYSTRSRDWYGRHTPDKYQQAFHGAHKTLAYSHVPYGVILDENADAGTLRQYAVVLVPNAAILSPSEIALFEQYVKSGGNLVVTGHSGLFGRYGEEAKASILEPLIGAKLVARLAELDNHVRLTKLPDGHRRLADDIPLDWPFLVHGPAAVYTPTTAAAFGELLKSHRTLRQRKGQEGTVFPNSADAPVGPALLVNQLGKGRVVCLACGPDFATGGEYPVSEARFLLRNVIRWLHPQPLVEISAPLNVEAVVTDDQASRTLRVHLIGYQSPPACTPPTNRPFVIPPQVEEPPMYRATVLVRRPIRHVEALNKNTVLRWEGNRVQAQVEDIHETLVIRYGSAE